MRYFLPLIAVSLLAGCTIQQRMPVREVAYDFSDYAYYDRPYAESPEYRTDHSAPDRSSVEHAPVAAETAEGRVTPSVAKDSPVAKDKAVVGPSASTGLVAGQGSNLCASPAH